MYLKESYRPCKNGGTRYTPRVVYGWYSYDNIGKKIPLVGHVCYADMCENSMKLFVPENIFNYSFDENCDVINAREAFTTPQGKSAMTWQIAEKERLSVELNVKEEFTWETKAYLEVFVNNIEMVSINFSEIAKNDYIESIEVIAEKVVNNNLHLIIRYSHQSNPGSFGGGNCGAGIEEFISYVKIDENFNPLNFHEIQSSSCIYNIYDKETEYDLSKPQDGIRDN